MVFSYFKEPITKEEIWKRLHVYKKHSGLRGSYLWDLGRYAIKRDYKALIYHYDWHWWNKSVVEANTRSNKSLISALNSINKEKDDWAQKKEVIKDIRYVKSGGKYKFEIPKSDIIDDFLMKRIPVILNVRSEDYYKNPKENYAHSIVVIGKKADEYILRDPYLAVNKMKEDDLIYACIRTGGWMMILIPQPKKFKEKSQTQQSKLL